MKYRIKNWSVFQHYKDRNPPWIKLHFAMLSSQDWVMLDDASRVLAVACMLIASRTGGYVPDDLDYIKRVAYLKSKPNLKPLIDSGFIEDASGCKQMLADASVSVYTETETETEKTIIPEDLLENREDIEAWIAYKKEMGKAYKKRGLEALWRSIRKIPQAKRSDSIEFCMANNWQGLFEKNDKKGESPT